MHITELTLHSKKLNKDLDMIQYGSTGQPIIVFPTFDSSAGSWETGKMIDALSQYIEDGMIQLFCIDSVDDETWYATHSDLDYRIQRLEGFTTFIFQNVCRFIKKLAPDMNKPFLAGCGIGATNAALCALRRPNLFSGLLALSGSYDAAGILHTDNSEHIADLSPLVLAKNLSVAKIKALHTQALVYISGQAKDECGIQTMRALQAVFEEKKLSATFEYWGFDVTHTWSWWAEMAAQLIPAMITPNGLLKRRYDSLAAVFGAAKARVDDLSDQVKQSEDAEKKAHERLLQEEKNILQKDKILKKAEAAAKELWEKRNRLAGELAALDKQAAALQAQANTAAKDYSDAQWFAGEARSSYEMAKSATQSAKDRIKAAQDGLDKIDIQMMSLKKSFHDLD